MAVVLRIFCRRPVRRLASRDEAHRRVHLATYGRSITLSLICNPLGSLTALQKDELPRASHVA
jgi:hypothetical protein